MTAPEQHPDTDGWLNWRAICGLDSHCTDHHHRPAVCRTWLPGTWGGVMPRVIAPGQPLWVGDEVVA